jgi:hypothetical protein
MMGGTTMFMKICIAAAVALGCTLAVPSVSYAAEKDKTAASATDDTKAAPATSHKKKKPKKGHADDIHNHAEGK